MNMDAICTLVSVFSEEVPTDQKNNFGKFRGAVFCGLFVLKIKSL